MTQSLETTLVGESRAMIALRAIIERAAPIDLPVLIEGPTGSGKELVAAALHARSGRDGPFVAFNVCAVSETMFEDALFGHVRGAFTGAVSERPGFLREADRGTVFLDEIGGLALGLQAKLLRALETGRFRPVGGTRDVETHVRVVAASNEPIAELVAAQRFRADLAHRLAAVVIRVPALEERQEDIPSLVYHFLRMAGTVECEVTSGALAWLCDRAWPGNVRELKQVVLWAAALCDGVITEATLASASGYRREGAELGASQDREHAERRDLRCLLERHGWNTAAAAHEMTIHRATLYRRMKRLGVRVPLDAIRAHSHPFARTAANVCESASRIISVNEYHATR